MKTKCTSTAVAPLALRLLLTLAVVLGHCCLSTLTAHALTPADGMGMHAHAQTGTVHAHAAAPGDSAVTQAPDGCGDSAPQMTERTVQWQAALPVARVAFTRPGDAAARTPPPRSDAPLRHARNWLQVYLI